MNTLFRLFGHLPLIVLHFIGACVGLLVWAVSARYRRTLAGNLSQALGRNALLRECLANAIEAGKGAFETAWVWTQPQTRLVKAVRSTSGWEAMLAAHAKGRGTLFVTPHLGCFEISAQYFAAQTGPITVLFRPPRKNILAPLMQAGRNRGAMRAVPADAAGVRQLLKALKSGEAIGILPDQVPREGEGLWAPFFGRPAYSMTLAARLAGNGGSSAWIAFARRLRWGRGFHLHLEPLTLPEGAPAARVAALNSALERQIRSCPAQYMWGYNRYKCPPGVTPPPAD
ncbi:lysophospholipid acyltransferase family protein [Niveibacterium sp. 24ML]|uniref:lysophospholipid acyltransferase family protein n=1 Tax=Niveibacterium sp. 24ML TaxID=2985512 RepID=UPI002270D44F|nr:lysophospholipid acyltransferase family protein [Niveibacterium sp. 24ML]MCX9155440.1 lysophospholipid acyltransferase family protein [Niveibacterium sp. 24ML]